MVHIQAYFIKYIWNATYLCTVYWQGKVHPFTGTEALYRPYDP